MVSGHLRTLVNAGIMQRMQQRRYAFCGSLMHDFVYNSIPHRTRRKYHLTTARWLQDNPSYAAQDRWMPHDSERGRRRRRRRRRRASRRSSVGSVEAPPSQAEESKDASGSARGAALGVTAATGGNADGAPTTVQRIVESPQKTKAAAVTSNASDLTPQGLGTPQPALSGRLDAHADEAAEGMAVSPSARNGSSRRRGTSRRNADHLRNSSTLLALLVYHYLRGNDLQSALDCAERLGEVAFHANGYSEAIRSFRKALAIDEDLAAASAVEEEFADALHSSRSSQSSADRGGSSATAASSTVAHSDFPHRSVSLGPVPTSPQKALGRRSASPPAGSTVHTSGRGKLSVETRGRSPSQPESRKVSPAHAHDAPPGVRVGINSFSSSPRQLKRGRWQSRIGLSYIEIGNRHKATAWLLRALHNFGVNCSSSVDNPQRAQLMLYPLMLLAHKYPAHAEAINATAQHVARMLVQKEANARGRRVHQGKSFNARGQRCVLVLGVAVGVGVLFVSLLCGSLQCAPDTMPCNCQAPLVDHGVHASTQRLLPELRGPHVGGQRAGQQLPSPPCQRRRQGHRRWPRRRSCIHVRRHGRACFQHADARGEHDCWCDGWATRGAAAGVSRRAAHAETRAAQRVLHVRHERSDAGARRRHVTARTVHHAHHAQLCGPRAAPREGGVGAGAGDGPGRRR